MFKSYEKTTGQWPHLQDSNGTFVLSNEKSDILQTLIGLWLMTNVDVHPVTTENY